MSDLSRRWETVRRDPLTVVLLAGLVLRLAWFLNARPEPVSDFLVYRWIAENMLDEGFVGVDEPSAFWLPGYPAFLAVISLISRATAWLSLVMVLMSTALCWLVHRFALDVGSSRQVALIAAGLCAVAPPFVLYSPILGTEHLFAIVLLAAFAAAVRVAGAVSWQLAGIGMLLGLATLIRGEALFYVPAVLALVSWATPQGRRLVAGGLVVGGLLVPIAPWMVRNMTVIGTGPALSTVGGMNFYFAHNPDHYGWAPDVPWTPGDDLEANRLGWELGLTHISEHPTSLVDSTLEGLRRQFSAHVDGVKWNASRRVGDGLEFESVPLRGFKVASTAVVWWTAMSLSLAALSLVLWRRWPTRMRILVIGMTVGNLVGYTVLFFGDARFRYTLDAVLLVPVALTVKALWEARQSASAPSET